MHKTNPASANPAFATPSSHSESFISANLDTSTQHPARSLRRSASALAIEIENYAGARSQTQELDRDNSSYLYDLAAWRDNGPSQGGSRGKAYQRIKAYLHDGKINATLDLRQLGLTSLPAALPSTLRHIDLEGNRLAFLPEALPLNLETLYVSRNELICLPAVLPRNLKLLDASSNKLTRLPDQLPDSIERLYVSGNHLAVLPEDLPASLKVLEVYSSRLECLPHKLPSCLEILRVDDNLLTCLPDNLPETITEITIYGNNLDSLPLRLPQSLQRLTAFDNKLRSLPRCLPPSMTHLHASGNRIRSLPEKIPSSMELIDLGNNPVISLPEDLFESLSKGCQISFSLDSIPPHVFKNLRATAIKNGRSRLTLSGQPSVLKQPAEASLHDAVEKWIGQDRKKLGQWPGFADKTGSKEFAQFLHRLHHEVNSSNPEFVKGINEWLFKLAYNPTLFYATMRIAINADRYGEHGVCRAHNEMNKAWLTHEVEAGKGDNNIAELIKMARGMFHRDQIEALASEKVKTLKFTDIATVYSVYLAAVYPTLNLPDYISVTPYFRIPGITLDDFKDTERNLKARENTDFPDYLCNLPAWQVLLSRFEGESFVHTNAELNETVGRHIPDADIDIAGQTGDAETVARAVDQLRGQRKAAVLIRSTNSFLEKHNLSAMLDKAWPELASDAETDSDKS
jgi:Leucine-rich repeat (LRR) protein